MTKVSVFGQDSEQEKKKNPIELKKYLFSDGFLKDANFEPFEFENVVLYKKSKFKEEYDIILCYNADSCGVYLGHWNDGVV